MEYGSVFGHGAYLGPDYTADYLRRSANLVGDAYGGAGLGLRRAQKTIEDFRTNRYDAKTGTLTFSDAQAQRLPAARAALRRFFSDPTTEHGLRPDAITDPAQLRQLTAFFAWTAWAAAGEPAGPQLLVHEQLAAGAAGRTTRRRRT